MTFGLHIDEGTYESTHPCEEGVSCPFMQGSKKAVFEMMQKFFLTISCSLQRSSLAMNLLSVIAEKPSVLARLILRHLSTAHLQV